MTARLPFLSSFVSLEYKYHEQNYIFFGQSVFGQLISLIEPSIISKASKECNADRYVKKFKTKDHLSSMVFCARSKCSSLREVSVAMLGLSGKTKAGSLPESKTTFYMKL
ncbi:MAG: DUF4372 domain-containing protein [Bacteroidota bacterium]